MNPGLVCAYMHSIVWTQNILAFVSLKGECQEQKNKNKNKTKQQQQQQQKHPACTIHEEGMWLPLWLDKKKKQ